jgi:hypothetical protein
MNPIVTIPTVKKTYTLTVSAEAAKLLASVLLDPDQDDSVRELGQMFVNAMDEADKK